MALGFTFIAAVLLIFSGIFVAGYGICALIFGGFASGVESAAGISAEVWSMIFSVGGIVLFLAGVNIFAGRRWARAVGLGVAILALIVGLISLGNYPVFASIAIVLNLGIIWSLGFRWTAMRSAL
jgi:hypothetical protein